MLTGEEHGREFIGGAEQQAAAPPSELAGRVAFLARVVEHVRRAAPYMTREIAVCQELGCSFDEARAALEELERSGAIVSDCVGKIGWRIAPQEREVKVTKLAIVLLLQSWDPEGEEYHRRDAVILSLDHDDRVGVFEAFAELVQEGRLAELPGSDLEPPRFRWIRDKVAEELRAMRRDAQATFADMAGPTSSTGENLHPPFLSNEAEKSWALAETREEAAAGFRELWGEDQLSEEGWEILAEDLSPEWLKPEPVPRDSGLFSYYASEQWSDEPYWWVPAEEGEEGAALYWSYEGF